MLAGSPHIFTVPILGKFLIYAPLHNLLALINRQALLQLRHSLMEGTPTPEMVQPLVEPLESPGIQRPAVRTGPLNDPLLLGLIPTRGCNLACRYCDFAAPKHSSPVMNLDLARHAIDAYLELLIKENKKEGQIHFFGGEPFYAWSVVEFAVNYASMRAAELRVKLRFEATTNGVYNSERCHWIAEHFDSIVLSLDGPADIQNYHRPALNGRSAFNMIVRNGWIFSQGRSELILRACVTGATVGRLPEIARWFSEEFHPTVVCFETLKVSPLAKLAGLTPPEPVEFARNFDYAVNYLQERGIEAVFSTADITSIRTSFCPVGQDALIVSPDGAVDACYLLQKDWEQRGLNMRLGWLKDSGFEINFATLQEIRDLTVKPKPLCTNCFCRYHCAGGCHVHHQTDAPSGHYDATCLETRLVTLTLLLRQLGQPTLVDQWLNDSSAMMLSAQHLSDNLFSLEVQ